MVFNKDSPPYSYEVVRESGENVMYINYLGVNYTPSLSESEEVMFRTINNLSEEPNISRIVFVQQRNFSYDFSQVKLLVEVASLYTFLVKQENILSAEKLSLAGPYQSEAFSFLSFVLNEVLKKDPIRAYREVKSRAIEKRALLGRGEPVGGYLRILENVLNLMENLEIIRAAKSFMDDYPIGDRTIYSKIFKADIMPNFTFTRMVATIPEDSEILDQYYISSGPDKSLVTILKREGHTKLTYHLSPPEYLLSEDHHMLLNLARNVLIEHRPSAEEFTDPKRTRQIFFNVARDLLQDLSNNKGIKLSYEDLVKLATILVRHTIGFGVLEVLLSDNLLQDLVVNAPISLSPVFVLHNAYGECITNIIPSVEDADSWAAKLRMISGRALDEANPVLDANLELGNSSARVAVVQKPLSSGGLAYALRRHRSNPWTLPLFIQNKMINGLGAGLLSFLIDGARTILIAGTRSSGKTSLLGSLLLEIMPNHRIITVEDTLELPVSSMRRLDYDILSMKVRSALMGESTEVSAEEGIRASLRLGDSALIVGEIRSEEARALYEAMRVGALANVVAGTIHGGSPYSVFDRVVNDLGVPITSFKATDIIVIVNPIKSPDGIHSFRRVIGITEVRKHWTKDPLTEGGFVDLMRYDVERDELVPTDDLINGNSEVIKEIASNVSGWAGNWDAVWDNVLLREKIKTRLVEASAKKNLPKILEAEFVVLSNNVFHQISEQVSKEKGLPESSEVFKRWNFWLEKEIEKI